MSIKGGRPLKTNEKRKLCQSCSAPDTCRANIRCAEKGNRLRICRIIHGGQKRVSPRGVLRKNIVHIG